MNDFSGLQFELEQKDKDILEKIKKARGGDKSILHPGVDLNGPYDYGYTCDIYQATEPFSTTITDDRFEATATATLNFTPDYTGEYSLWIHSPWSLTSKSATTPVEIYS